MNDVRFRANRPVVRDFFAFVSRRTHANKKKRVFNFLFKVSIEMDSLRNLGRTFHNLVQQTEGLLPSRVLSLSLYSDTGLRVIEKNLGTKVLSP